MLSYAYTYISLNKVKFNLFEFVNFAMLISVKYFKWLVLVFLPFLLLMLFFAFLDLQDDVSGLPPTRIVVSTATCPEFSR